MAYTYRGTKITGMSVSGKKFPKSGIKNASKGQTYFNKSTGHVYKCTDGGKAKDAKWKYLRTDIAKKPTVAVSGLGAPVRENNSHKMKATWKTPAAMVDEKKGNRATALEIDWYLGIAGTDPKKVVKTSNEKLTESTINLNSLTIGNKTYERKDFYPYANKPVLNYVTVKVTSKNAKGAGASAKATREFLVPRKPTISDFTFDAETGEVSCTIDTDAGDDYRERYDTRYKMTVYYSDTKETKTIHDTSTTLTSKTIVFDDAYYASRDYGEYAKVTVQAWARGYKGDSCRPEENQKTFYVSYPAQASIDDVQVSSKDSTGKCTIYVDTHSTEEHPVDRVKLEYLANCTYAEANMIPGDASWEQTDILDDATCKALAMSVSNLIPDRGKYTWIRLKTFHANETVLYRYSQYWRVTDLETPAATAADDKIKILSATAGTDGKSAVVHLAWDDGQLPSTGTEISWDEEEDAWKSTKNPSDYTFEWEDKTEQGQPIPVTVDGVTYPHSATITIKGLDESTKYFIKARRYSEGDETTYSEYSNSATVVTSEKPESVTATADRYIPHGAGLNVYWTFAGNGLQREWQIVDSNGTILANGEGSLGSTQISADRLIAFAEDGDIEFTVQVSTGSGFVVSESKKVTIIEPPTLEITGNSLVHDHEEVERNFSGEIVSFEPREEEFVKSLKVPLEPIQDLHGYGKPWVGGAGKNKLNASSGSGTTSGVTFTNTNGIITASGTATATVYRQVGTFFAESGVQYIMTGCPSDGAPNKYRMTLAGYGYDYGSGYSFTGDGASHNVTCDIYPAAGAVNVTFTPMIRLASVSDATYAPYANICPITGWTGCEVDVSGKNLLPYPYATASKSQNGITFTVNSDGSIHVQGTASANTPFNISSNIIDDLHLQVGDSVIVTDGKVYDASSCFTRILYADNNTGLTRIQNSYTLTVTSEMIERGLLYQIWVPSGVNVNSGVIFYPMIRLLSETDSTYEPYNGQTYNITWQDEAGAVYGGTVDVVSGELVATMPSNASIDLGSLNWYYEATVPRFYSYSVQNVVKKPPKNSVKANALCDRYQTVPLDGDESLYSGIDQSVAISTGGVISVRDENYTNASDFKTAVTGSQLVYELATPTTYQLDPVQVALLIGEQNNIWNDVGITELKLAEVTLDEDQLQTNDLMLSFKSNKICDIKLIVASQGAVGQFPQGILRQTAGDTIHSNVYVPVWTESNEEFTTTVHLPLALDFWDKGSYTLRAVAIDRQTGLKSSEVGLEFAVAWAHQAPSIEPLETYTLSTDTTVSDNKNYYSYDSETQVYTVVEPIGTENPHNEGWYDVTVTNYVTLTPIDEIDDNGFHHQAVQINLTPPPNAETDDVYDIYRMTGDGAQLIGQSFPQTYIATDEYAPFGEDLTNHYRIAVRTADGDVEFSDIEYVLEGEGIRLDWAEGFIEYPYSIGIGDSYKKDVDIRKHLDGSIGAYWNHGVERSGSLSTDAIKVLQQDDIDLTRRLGRYTGPVFVRTREGTAFEADVQISNLSSKNIAVMSIAIDATEVDLTEEFMLPTPFNLDEGEQ